MTENNPNGNTLKDQMIKQGNEAAFATAPKQKSSKDKEKEKKKKEPVVLNNGITGAGTDYTVYVLNARETITAIIAGALIGFIASYVYFESIALGIILGVIVGIKAISIYRGMLQKKRKKELRLQFRDLLESLSNSYTVGMTASRAFHAAHSDMMAEHGEKAHITKEMQLLCAAHDNQGIEIKDMLNDFAMRSGLEDIKSFASVFDVSSNLGGDIAKIIRETRDMIGEKIEVEMEIQTMVTGQKNQLNVLTVMPFVVVIVVRTFNMASNGPLVIIVKLIAMGLFIFAYWLGTRIVDIKI